MRTANLETIQLHTILDFFGALHSRWRVSKSALLMCTTCFRMCLAFLTTDIQERTIKKHRYDSYQSSPHKILQCLYALRSQWMVIRVLPSHRQSTQAKTFTRSVSIYNKFSSFRTLLGCNEFPPSQYIKAGNATAHVRFAAFRPGLQRQLGILGTTK